MIAAATDAHCVLLQHAPQRSGLASSEHDDAPRGTTDELARQRGNAGQSLKEVQCGSLGGKERRGVPLDLRDLVAGFAPAPVRALHANSDVRIALTERFASYVQAGDHA